MSYKVKGIIANYKQIANNAEIQINGDICIDDKFNLWIEETTEEPRKCILMPKDTKITVGGNNLSNLCFVVAVVALLNKSKCTFTIDMKDTGCSLQSIEINN